MDFFDLRNDVNKVGKGYSGSVQKRKNKKALVETKAVQASSLDVLSSYGLASIKRSSISNSTKTPDEKIKDLTNRLLQDENLKNFDIQNYLTPENVELAELLCYGKDELGREIFPDKSVIHFTLEELHSDNYDFALELLIGKDESGNDLFQDKSMIWGIISQISNKAQMINFIKNLEPEMLEEFRSIPAFQNLKVDIDATGNIVLPPEDEIISTVSDFVDEQLKIARQLCYGKDENGNQLFTNKDKISSVLASSIEFDMDILSLMLFGRNQNGQPLFSSFDKLNTVFVWANDLKRPDLIKKIYWGKDEKGNDYLPDKRVATDILYEFINLYKNSRSDTVVEKISFFENLCFAKTENGEDVLPNKEVIPLLMPYAYWGSLDIIEKLCLGKNANGDDLLPDKKQIPIILSEVYSRLSYGAPSDTLVQQRFEFANEILNTLGTDVEKYPNIFGCISCINEENIDFMNQLCFEKDLNGHFLFEQKDFIGEIAHSINPVNIDFVKKLCFGKDENGNDLFPRKDLISKISKYVTNINVEFVEQLCFGKDENGNDLFSQKDLIPEIIACSNFQIKDILREFCFGKDEKGNDLFSRKDLIKEIYPCVKNENIEVVRKLCFGKDEQGNELFEQKDFIPNIALSVNEKNSDFIETLCIAKDENGDDLFSQKELISGIARYVNKENSEVASILCYGKDEFGNDLFPQKDLIGKLLSCVHNQNSEFMLELCCGKDEFGNDLFPQKDLINRISYYVNQKNSELVKKLCYEKDESGNRVFLQNDLIFNILPNIHSQNILLADVLCFEKNEQGNQICFDFELISEILKYSNDEDVEDVKFLLSLLENKEISFNEMIVVLDKTNSVTFEDITKLQSLVGKEATEKLTTSDLCVACRMIDLINKKDTNEIDLAKKKILIRNLVDANVSLYNSSAELKNMCPLLPTNKEEYCSLLQSLCKSIGIETNELSTSEISEFNQSVDFISSYLGSISDEKFNNLKIEQAYSKDDFISDVLNIVSGLEKNEKQKVFDYFGFELVPNENTKIGYSILGYPVNLNNGKKLAKIDNPQTQAVIEQLRPEVIKFSKENPITCSDKNLEDDINKILELCPELRTQIGRVQHGKHDFDVFKHSLKVMQKTTQNPKFEKLSDSDKKVLLLSSLLHDTTKAEGCKDVLHANESAFDAFYITKKFNLSKEETNKLYALIKFHEWLGNVNSSSVTDENEREKIRKSIAYDLHYDNLFELSKIMTEADLKAVQSNDNFYNEVKEIFEINSDKISKMVEELKYSQPLLPVTKIPPASKIKEAITVVNSDGSTNLKGVYQDKNGMVIIKYNEVENDIWEKIGFPAGSISKGIDATGFSTKMGTQVKCNVDTGNIKFFAHGLDYAEQLQNFDVFALPDTDALLSVSYMELPESKYRLFRPQGVLLDVDTKYIHGGGNTDAGSGCKKSLDVFKKDYAYIGSRRYEDRTYVSELIKDALGLTDEEYVSFVSENANKSISEIEPIECRERLVQAFATINSNTRKGERSYNEMYVTNPNVMAVFAYPTGKEIGDINEFMSSQQDFLKQYALEEDLPFIVFGD